MPRPAALKEMPARQEASSISPLAALSPAWASLRLRQAMEKAFSPMASLKGVAFRATQPSAAWVSTSMPVSAVTAGGTPESRDGSSTARSGSRASSTRGYFTPASASVRTAKEVTSDPVPAVVGMHHSSGGGFPPAKWRMALAQSMGEPPPKASTASGPNARRTWTPWATSRRDGSGLTWSNTLISQPFSRAFTPSSRPDLWARNSSVTMSTRRPASSSRAARASGPNRISGLIAKSSMFSACLFLRWR